jgi:cytochrome P450
MSEQDALTLADLLADISEVFDRGRSLRFYQAMNEKAAMVRALVLAVVRKRRKSPGDDAVSVMLALSGAEFCFDEAEIADRAIFLFMASIETTSGLIGCVLRALLLYTNERARLVNGEISPAEAFDELVRFSGPIMQASRFAVEDVEVRGQMIAAGQRVVLMIGAANRDPAAWPDPDRLILGRPGPGNVAFGGGTHQCLGVGLAKLETCVAVEKFLQLRNPRLMSCEQAWMPLRTLRRLSHLPVTFG